MLNVFLLLTSYYILKTLREPLILVGGGAEALQATDPHRPGAAGEVELVAGA